MNPDPKLMIIITAVTEFAKIYLPDKIESKVIPALAIVVGIGLGVAEEPTIQGALVGFISGMTASGLYKVTTKIIDKVKSK